MCFLISQILSPVPLFRPNRLISQAYDWGLSAQTRLSKVDLPYNGNNYDADEVVKLNKVSIRYGDRTILKELDWTVHRGEKWALSGENGAGKSTLLS